MSSFDTRQFDTRQQYFLDKVIRHSIIHNMATPKQISIKSVIRKINRSFFIPDIQRSYVWLQNPKQRKIEQLFDSLMRGYPIGAFLFWVLDKGDIEAGTREDAEHSGKLNFQLYKFIEKYDVRRHHNEKIDVGNVDAGELSIVLDGQQRLTSLFIGLRGSRTLRKPYARGEGHLSYPEKFLYLNLRHTPDDSAPDDCYQFEFLTKEEASIKNEEEHWFRLSTAMDFENEDDMWQFCDDNELSREEQKILKKFSSILNSEISCFEESEKNLEKVLKIFIRVNSGGTQLSYSDLLMSILTATFQSDIREKMESEVDHLAELGFGCVGRDQILKTCMLLTDSNHIFKLENFNRANIGKVESNWERIIGCIESTVSLIASFGYKSILSSGYIVTTIAYYLFSRGISQTSANDKASMQHFVRIAQISGYFSASLDTKLSTMRSYIRETANFSDFVRKGTAEIEEWRMTEDRLKWLVDNSQYGNSATLPLLQILYPNLAYATATFHIDHIYPKSKFTANTEGLPSEYIGRANCLFNLQLLEGGENESKNAKDPEAWLKSWCDTEEKRHCYLRNNYIPEQFKLLWENLPEFEQARKEAMLSELKRAFAEFNESVGNFGTMVSN